MTKLKIILATVIVLAGQVELHAKESSVKQSMDKPTITVEELIKFKNAHPHVKAFLKEASKSRFTEVKITAPEPPNLKVKDGNGMPTDEWTEWTIKNTHHASLKEMAKVLSTLVKVPKGYLQLSDPNDTPLAYDRTFLQIEYNGDDIIHLEQRSL